MAMKKTGVGVRFAGSADEVKNIYILCLRLRSKTRMEKEDKNNTGAFQINKYMIIKQADSRKAKSKEKQAVCMCPWSL